jgi:hypothetical protein
VCSEAKVAEEKAAKLEEAKRKSEEEAIIAYKILEDGTYECCAR